MHNKYLKGITWNHSRGYVPMIATAQRFSELNPGTDIQWHKRTLQEFADKPIGKLVEDFDLLVIDHPWTGFAAENNLFVPLDDVLPQSFLEELKCNSVGSSYESYRYNGQLWALPIDAATPVAAYRTDLRERTGIPLPQTFDELLTLAKTGNVILPAVPIDTLMNFFMFCTTLGAQPFANKDEVVEKATGVAALEIFKTLTDKIDKACFHYNPINVYEAMTTTDKYIYCPFAYGYSNYARKGYSRSTLAFTDMATLENDQKLISTIGGTGIAVSHRCKEKEAALQYIQYVASAACQQSIYFESGGQPAHREAWLDTSVNEASDHYFTATLPALDRSYLRPRYNGYMYFQDRAGDVVRDYLMQGGKPEDVFGKLNRLFHESKQVD